MPKSLATVPAARRTGLAALTALALATGAGTIVGTPAALSSDRLDMYEVFRGSGRAAQPSAQRPGLIESLFGGPSRRAPELIEAARPVPVLLPQGDMQEGPFRTISGPDIPVLMQKPVASVYEDPTLRPGDMVVTERGVEVFRGRAGRDRHSQADFVAVDLRRLPKAERTMLSQVDNQVKGIYREARRSADGRVAEAETFTVRSVKPRVIPGVAAIIPTLE